MATNNSSLYLNGTNQYVKLPTNASIRGMSAFTWMAWVQVGDLADSPYKKLYVERQGVGSKIRFSAQAYHNRLRFELAVQDNKTDTNYDYVYNWDSRWHHIAFSARISGTNPTYTMYLDGSKVAEGTLIKPNGVDAITDTAPLGGSIYLGNHSVTSPESFPSDRYWNGYVDEILIFNEAKTDSDVLNYFTSHDIWDMSDTAMFSYWRFDENTGTTTTDSDNPTWTGTLYQSGSASSALWDINRPFLGNGTLDTSAPTTPASPVTSNITDDGFTATWTGSTDNIYVQYYELQVSEFSNFSSYTSYNTGRTLTQDVSGLLPSTNYYWRVRALDAASNSSGYTVTQSLTTSGVGDLVPPDAPTNLRASSITYSSFLLAYDASVSVDVSGYKVDVGLDSNFDTYLSGWQNKDVGNVTSVAVNGTQELRTYYVRARAYDAAQNESFESATLVLQTPSQPDLIAPSIVETRAATSVTSSAFTANWNAAQDNVGVVAYDLDISLASDFTNIVRSVSLGNILSYRVDNLAANTTYYYRLRARDAAGNVSSNATEGTTVTTTPTSVDEGGFITVDAEPLGDAYVSSSATGTNYGTATDLIVAGNGTTNTKAAHLLFDASTLQGALQSAVLNFYVTEAAGSQIQVVVDNVTFDELTITWANQPTVSGTSLFVTANQVNQWVSVDISSFITTPDIYDVKIFTTASDSMTLSSREGVYAPYMSFEYDPATATSVQTIDLSSVSEQRTNYCTNPNFESGATTGWSISGGVTATAVAGEGISGSYAMRAVTDGLAISRGVSFGSVAATPATEGEVWSLVVSVKGTEGVQANIRLYAYGASGQITGDGPATSTILRANTYQEIPATLTMPAGTTYAVAFIYIVPATAATFYLDNVLLEKTPTVGAYFDGNTSGAYWVGTANLSQSHMGASTITSVSSFVGDSNDNNAVTGMFRRSASTDWITLASTTSINRTTKQGTIVFGPSFGTYNYILNPSFEVDVSNWTLPTGSARVSTTFTRGSYSASIPVDATIGVGAFGNLVPTVAGVTWYARADVNASVGTRIRLGLRFLDASMNDLYTTTTTYGVNGVIGNDLWTTLTFNAQAPASTAYVQVTVLTSESGAGSFYLDAIQLSQTDNPYLDGDSADGVWEGSAHNSTSALVILPDTSYDIEHTYTDVDGLYDGDGIVAANISTASVPDNVTTAGVLTLTPSYSSIEISLPYSGDDNSDMIASAQWRRSDLSAWSDTLVTVNRESKVITGSINNLNAGTSYTVQVTITDPDGVYGTTNGSVSAVVTTLLDQDSPSSTTKIMFGGFVLMDGSSINGSVGVTKHDAFGFPDRRVQIEELPRVEGAVELQNLWGKRTITMSGYVEGATRGELEDNLSALRRALAPKQQQLIIDTLSNEARHYLATCESLSITEEAGVNIRHLTWDAQFVCADPFAYASSLTVMPEFTVYDGSTLSVVNNGDLTTTPTFKIRTTHPQPITLTIVNNTTGERITPSVTILSGDRMSVDTTRLSVTKNGVEVQYIGGFPRLNVGENTFAIYLTASGVSPSILLEVSYQERYL